MPRFRRSFALVMLLVAAVSIPACGVARMAAQSNSEPPPGTIATIEVFDPFTDRTTIITVQLGSSPSQDLRSAVAEIQNKQWREARLHLDRAIEANPRDYRAHLLRALIHENRGLWPEALDAFKTSIDNRSTPEAEEGLERCRAKQAIEDGE